MTKEFTPHDLFFAKLMEDKEMARALFKAYFPSSVQNYIDFETAEMEHLNPKFINEVLSGYKVCDVLYKTTSHDGITLLLAHCEHQSYPDKTIALRAICYALLAVLSYHNDHENEPIPPILSLVYYNGEKPYTFSMDPLALFGNLPDDLKKYVLFKPQLIDLTQKSDAEFSEHGAIEPFETLFKHAFDPTNDKKLNLYSQTIPKIPRHLLVAALQYMLASVEKKKREAFLKMISTQVEKKTFISIADSFREEGVEIGIEKSRIEIARNLLLKNLDLDLIAESTGLDLKTIEEIKKALH